MAVTGKLYPESIRAAYIGSLNIGNPIKCALLTSSYIPNFASDYSFILVSTYEVSGAGYTAGGAAVANTEMTDTADYVLFTGNNVTWANSSITARYAVIYESTSNLVMALVDFGEDKTSFDGTFTIDWDVQGIFKITV